MWPHFTDELTKCPVYSSTNWQSQNQNPDLKALIFLLLLLLSKSPGWLRARKHHGMDSVLVSGSRRNKLPQTKWLTTAVYPPTVQDARSLKSRCQLGSTPSGGSRGEFLLCLFHLPEAVGIPYGHITATSASVVILPAPLLSMSNISLPDSYKDTCHWI